MSQGPRWVLVHQGWLLKRGEGYDEDDASTQASSSTTGGGGGGGLGVAGLGQPGVAGLGTHIERLLAGKSEKRRFFRLVRQAIDPVLAAGPGAGRPGLALPPGALRMAAATPVPTAAAELRYYSREISAAEPVANSGEASLKGTIRLTHNCTLAPSRDDASLKLVTPGRSYFLRPDAPPESAQAKTDTSQWSDALRRELRALWTAEHAKQSSSRVMSMNMPGGLASPGSFYSRRLTRGESNLGEVAELEREMPSTLEEVLLSPADRAEFREFLSTALAVENLDFYEAVEELANKGGTKVDAEACERILREFVRAGAPREVNLSSGQRARLVELGKTPAKMTVQAFAESKGEIFKLMEENFFKRFLRDAIDRTGAFSALYATQGFDGFNSVLEHFGPVKTDLDRTIATLRSTADRVQAQIAVLGESLASRSRDVAVPSQPGVARAVAETYALAVARLDALTSYHDELRTEVVAPLEAFRVKLQTDLDVIVRPVAQPLHALREARRFVDEAKAAFERVRSGNNPQQIEQARSHVIECEAAFESAESVHSKALEQAMARFESLELLRIETQVSLVRHALKAEVNLSEDLRRGAEDLLGIVKSVIVHDEVAAAAFALQSELGPAF